MTAEADVRKVIEDWAGAVRRRNLDGILRHHAADVVMFDVPPPFESRGIEAYRQTWTTFFDWAREPIMFDIREMQVVAGDDVAFAFAAMRCAGGKEGDLDFRLTVGLRLVGGQWTIVHEHHSIPAED
ncbi:MAG TPA: nuclear transport factor 2 family protein [Caulobacteraceae bacterium]|jgi:ketosteroid isomerase-like protein